MILLSQKITATGLKSKEIMIQINDPFSQREPPKDIGIFHQIVLNLLFILSSAGRQHSHAAPWASVTAVPVS